MNSSIVAEFGKMVQAVERNVDVAKHNLTLDIADTLSHDIAKTLTSLADFERLLQELLDESFSGS